jgi:hypothetical protein
MKLLTLLFLDAVYDYCMYLLVVVAL